jgi:predicted amidohydrolase
VLTEAGTGPAIRLAHLDAASLRDTRRRLPLLEQRRPELY